MTAFAILAAFLVLWRGNAPRPEVSVSWDNQTLRRARRVRALTQRSMWYR